MLGPFRGAPAEHVRIPVTEEICGADVAHGNTVIVDDVASDRRYLACSLEARSEIVVPIRVNDGMVGEIDIDTTGYALSEMRIGKAMDLHTEIMRNDLLGGVLVGQRRL